MGVLGAEAPGVVGGAPADSVLALAEPVPTRMRVLPRKLGAAPMAALS